jgi:hypothetical protein
MFVKHVVVFTKEAGGSISKESAVGMSFLAEVRYSLDSLDIGLEF